MLFKNYPQITYKIGTKDITLVDIFKNISFTNVDNNKAFDDYYIQDGETPEIVSLKFYGTTSYSWLVLLVNNILDIKKDWFVSAREYNTQKENKLGGDAIYIPALPEIQPGDILVKVTSTDYPFSTAIDNTVYRHVSEFDPYLRVVRGISGSGQLYRGDIILFARQNSDGTVIPIQFNDQGQSPTTTDYTNIIHIEPYENSVDYFITGNDVILNPYMDVVHPGGTAISPISTYLDDTSPDEPNNFGNTLLYYYMNNEGGLPVNTSKSTKGTNEYNKYIAKQKIRILKQELISSVLSAIQNALNGDNVGKIFKVEL